jgi:3-oxoadipate enol-lactonase
VSVAVEHSLDGPEDAPVLVLSNSLGTTHRMWDEQMPALVERFRVLRYDKRGHGGSSAPPGPYSIEDLAGDALALLHELGIEGPVHWAGVSIGGMTGLWLAANEPGRIERLVGCCTAAHLPPRDMWEDRAATVREQGMEAVAEATLERWFSPRMHEQRPEALEPFRADLLACDPEGYAGCCLAIAGHDVRADLGSIGAPTLVIAGEDDPATPPELGREIADGVPGARLVVLDGLRHLANVEGAAEVNRLLLEHLGAGART